MDLKKLGFLLLAVFVFWSCSEDRPGFFISQNKQNKIDDRALVKYLEEHYFAEDGSVKVFSSKDKSDDHYTPLKELAEKAPEGYYVVKNPKHQAAGRSISDNQTDKILIQYNLQLLKALEQKDSVYYLPATIVSTVNSTGLPEWDPVFYHTTKEADSYEVKSIIEGLKKFKSSEKKADEEPYVNFQGLILVPSRLAHGRSSNPFNIKETDLSLILNFELYQVVQRKE